MFAENQYIKLRFGLCHAWGRIISCRSRSSKSMGDADVTKTWRRFVIPRSTGDPPVPNCEMRRGQGQASQRENLPQYSARASRPCHDFFAPFSPPMQSLPFRPLTGEQIMLIHAVYFWL